MCVAVQERERLEKTVQDLRAQQGRMQRDVDRFRQREALLQQVGRGRRRCGGAASAVG